MSMILLIKNHLISISQLFDQRRKSVIAPLLISGPSGVGKSYLLKYLEANYSCERIVPVTTRIKRPAELENKDYKFLSFEEYMALENSGALFMSNPFFNAFYGYEWEAIQAIISAGNIPMTEVYTPLIQQFLNAYPDSATVFLIPQSLEFLEARMKIRGDDEEKITYRLSEGLKEVEYYCQYAQHLYSKAYFVSNSNFDHIIKEVVSLIFPNN